MAAISISGTDKSLYKVGIMFIVSGILDNIGVVVGIFGISLYVPEISLVMHLLRVRWPPFLFPVLISQFEMLILWTLVIEMCVLENIDVAVGIFRLSLSTVELYLVIF